MGSEPLEVNARLVFALFSELVRGLTREKEESAVDEVTLFVDMDRAIVGRCCGTSSSETLRDSVEVTELFPSLLTPDDVPLLTPESILAREALRGGTVMRRGGWEVKGSRLSSACSPSLIVLGIGTLGALLPFNIVQDGVR